MEYNLACSGFRHGRSSSRRKAHSSKSINMSMTCRGWKYFSTSSDELFANSSSSSAYNVRRVSSMSILDMLEGSVRLTAFKTLTNV